MGIETQSIVFDSLNSRCPGSDMPDAGARAFRNDKNLVSLVASSSNARSFVGKSLNSTTYKCDVIYSSHLDDEPKNFADREWIAATYTLDGQRVHALIHNEFQGNRRPNLCPSRNYFRCWRNSITYAFSEDGGESFVAPKPDHLIATLPYPYDGQAGKHTGYFNPTNIIEKDGYFYSLFAAEGYKAQKNGMCLMRTRTLDKPASWRAWDGKDFTIRFADPYRENITDPAQHVCEPVGKPNIMNNQSGLVRHLPSGKYILTMHSHVKDAGGKIIPGFYFSTSPDLIHWSPRQLIRQTPISTFDLKGKSPAGCKESFFEVYPSLLDDNSPSRNFETVDDEAWLYFTRMYTDETCQPSAHRDLLRQRVRLTLGSGDDRTPDGDISKPGVGHGGGVVDIPQIHQ